MPSPIVKGHPPMGGRPKGSLNKETLSKLAARARFDEKVSQSWDEVIQKLIANHPTYVADQMMEKATEKHQVDFGDKKPLSQKKIEKLNQIMLDDDEE